MNLSSTAPIPTSQSHQQQSATPRRGGLVRFAALGLLGLTGGVGVFSLGAIPRWKHEQALNTATAGAITALPTVNVIQPRRDSLHTERQLPGSAFPYLQADLFARTNGYLKRRLVDIGDRVTEGQLLAEIEAPEVDAQLQQARAAVVQSKATLTRSEADEVYAGQQEVRFTKLNQQNAATQQDYENMVTLHKSAIATVAATKATIQVNEADVQRLAALQSFQKLTAPFAGVITARNVDPGALVTADNPSSERLLFRVQAMDPLRVFVDVPQVDSTYVKVGQTAVAFRREDPGHQFTGKVTRTADSLDNVTRTLRTEVQVPNSDGDLLPGMYLQVRLITDRESAPLMIPTAALVIRSHGPTVAALDEHNVVHYRSIQVGRDYGAEIEVLSGLKEEERVVMHPGDDLPEGQAVTPLVRDPKT